jgi:hypothetical protein
MTALNASGYGMIYLTPNRMVDFSAGTATINWELSTMRMSVRDWVDIWITPYGDNLTLPFDQGDVDLQGVPRQGLHIIMSEYNGKTTWRAYTINNFQETEIPGQWWTTQDDALAAAGRAPSASVRDTYELQVSRGHVKFGIPAINFWPIDANVSTLPFDQGVVQFGHHSYNPAKDGAGVPVTWHWDNISISPAAPFTLIKADRRYVDNASQTVNFNQAAPAGSSLRFSANGNNIRVSLDGGKTWSAARLQPAETNVDRFKSYFTAIPSGTTSVKVRGDAIFNGPFFAQDFSIWSQGTSAPSKPATSTPTAAPTKTASSTPATAPARTATAVPSKPSATPAPQAAYDSSASVSRTSLAAGTALKVTANVTASAAARALVDIEIDDPSGNKVFQQAYDGQSFAAGQGVTFSPGWTVPAWAQKGTYTVKVGVFLPGWGTLYHWNDSAATFTVQ